MTSAVASFAGLTRAAIEARAALWRREQPPTWYAPRGPETLDWWRCRVPARALGGQVAMPPSDFVGLGSVIIPTCFSGDYVAAIEVLHGVGRPVFLDIDDDLDADGYVFVQEGAFVTDCIE